MRLLYLAGTHPCAHDYGNAFLFDGLATVLGYDRVIDAPANPTFHLQRAANGELLRDGCALDSDLDWPDRSPPTLDEITRCDAIVLCTPDATSWRVCGSFPKLPVIAVDFSDEVRDRRAEYAKVAQRPLAAYCKRELPLGEKWGHPFPLSYPARRVGDLPEKEPVIFYHATDHNGGAPGIPRRAIVDYLRASVPAANLDVELYRGQEKGSRPSPEEYHARMARSSVGISWNGAPNWDCNRFWENLAYGLAMACEIPRIEISGIEDLQLLGQYNTPKFVAVAAAAAIEEPEQCRIVGQRGREWFLRYGSSEARARQLIGIIERSV